MIDTEIEKKTLYIEAAFEVMGRALPITDGRSDVIKALAMTAIWAGQGAIPDYELWDFILYPDGRPVQWPESLGPWPPAYGSDWEKAFDQMAAAN